MQVRYVQPTIGGAHMERIRALALVPGIQCRGVALATHERTRAYRLTGGDRTLVDTVLTGVYEDIPLPIKLAALFRYVRRESPCTLIIDRPSDPVQFLAGRLAQALGGRAITRWASTVLDQPRNPAKERVKRLIYRGWDGYLVTGKRALEYLTSFGVISSAATVCGNPVNSNTQNADCVVSVRLDTFLFVGRFLPLKNLRMLARAYRAYRVAGGTWGLVLVGFGETEAQLRAESLGLPDVEFAGHLQGGALADRYLTEGCLVLPSYSETWGLVVTEAMHGGMPVLVSQVCGCVPELVREGQNGFALPPHDVKAWTQAMHVLSRFDQQERAQLGAQSQLIASAHTSEAWAARVGEAIRRAWN